MLLNVLSHVGQYTASLALRRVDSRPMCRCEISEDDRLSGNVVPLLATLCIVYLIKIRLVPQSGLYTGTNIRGFPILISTFSSIHFHGGNVIRTVHVHEVKGRRKK